MPSQKFLKEFQSKHPKEHSNSLNYCKLKFDMDTMKIQNQRMKNRIRNLRIYLNDIQTKIEKDLGFSLNDDDARIKLDHLSKIIQIPEKLYKYLA